MLGSACCTYLIKSRQPCCTGKQVNTSKCNKLFFWVQCSKYYDGPTGVTRLKVAPSMADPTSLKGRVMGPLLVLVCPFSKENIIVTCNIVSFLRSLYNFLMKNVIVFLFWKSNFKMVLIWKKRAIFDPLFTFFSHQGKDTGIPSAQILHTCTRILLTLLTCLPSQFCKNYELIMYGFSLVRLLALILIRAIWNNQ